MVSALSYSSVEGLMGHFTSPFSKNEEENGRDNGAFPFVEAMFYGWFKEWADNMPKARLMTHLLTATAGYLDKFGGFWGVRRRDGEVDEPYRLRIGAVIVTKWGALNMDELLGMAAILLQTQPSSFEVNENTYADGSYAPARIRINVDPDAFTDAGVPAGEEAQALDDLILALEEAAPAGVIIEGTSIGSAYYDDGTTEYDDPEDIYH